MQKSDMEGESTILEMAEEDEPFSERGFLGLSIDCHVKLSLIQSGFQKFTKNDLHSTLQISSSKYISEREIQLDVLEGHVRNCKL